MKTLPANTPLAPKASAARTPLGGLSQGSLNKQLKELEKDGVIPRDVYPEFSPRVEYSLTDKGMKLLPILEKMKDFGKEYGMKPEIDEV
ncbi:winged helix-turn-helix transcriptional regulator [Paenibacillus illinoisensis]|uniref:winged helix-turn-helix transcriptional regulator n=1 Tax=Paenibacillus illinoisensis TaxID=59845 RepID=UPI001FE9ED8A|nr:winged helix-turn-helix transcriptional regulator [Paenibacillus illinoisensis]